MKTGNKERMKEIKEGGKKEEEKEGKHTWCYLILLLEILPKT